MRLVNTSTGEAVVGRCRATNLCRYCQQLYVLETVEMLAIDAAEYAPTLWAVLTAREHLTRAQCRRHLDMIRRGLKRRWPAIEWFSQVEFQRRGALHLNLLIKGVSDEDADELREDLTTRWCRRVDAEPVGQWLGPIAEAGGVVRYLQKTLSHGLKQEQAPPIGWRGHRTSQTRGYLVRPASVMREEARRALKLKRALWRALEAGLDAYDAELVAHELLAAADRVTWRLVHLNLRPNHAAIRPYGSGGAPAADDLVADVDRAQPPPPPTQPQSSRFGHRTPAGRDPVPIGHLPPLTSVGVGVRRAAAQPEREPT